MVLNDTQIVDYIFSCFKKAGNKRCMPDRVVDTQQVDTNNTNNTDDTNGRNNE